jgi:putative hydrolase of the HAD superfamily
MILIFDLDDTLYPERSYVHSGFRAVADHLQQRHGWPAAETAARLGELLDAQGRGALFDTLLHERGDSRRWAVHECLQVYRGHHPHIALHAAAQRLLTRLALLPYVVTDGHKGVQQRKLEALSLLPRLRHAYITHRYGVRHSKPSTHCFELIRRREGCAWRDMAYIGDNPAKDFVNLNPLGMRTVRVHTGEHRHRVAAPGSDAQHHIDSLDELPALIPEVNWQAAQAPAGLRSVVKRQRVADSP